MVNAIHIGVAAGVISTIIAIISFAMPSEQPIIVEQTQIDSRKNISLYIVAVGLLTEEWGCPSKDKYNIFVYSDPELRNKPITIEYSLDNIFWDWWISGVTDNHGTFTKDNISVPNMGDVVYSRVKFLGDDEFHQVTSEPFKHDRTERHDYFDELCEYVNPPNA